MDDNELLKIELSEDIVSEILAECGRHHDKPIYLTVKKDGNIIVTN